MSDCTELLYVHDPMCSWCWGFRPVLTRLCSQLPEEIRFRRLLGGLAADSDQPMPRAMQQQLRQTWEQIQLRIPGTRFNYDFWANCLPRRSTYPACRAVIVARMLDAHKEGDMILAIQQAYYLRGMNPSDTSTLVGLAGELALDRKQFAYWLEGDTVEAQLQAEIAEARLLGASSFPTLLLKSGQAHQVVPLDYTSSRSMLDTIQSLIA